MTTTADWQCPDCGGAWLRSFVFDHDPQTCRLRDREDATHHADYERLHTRSTLDRAATETEIELFIAITGYAPTEAEFRHPNDPLPTAPAPMTTVTRLASGIHHRVVAGLDPDVLAQELTA